MHLPLSLHLPSGAERGEEARKGKVKAGRKVPVGHLMRNVFALFAHTGSKQTAILAGALRNASLFPADERGGRCKREKKIERERDRVRPGDWQLLDTQIELKVATLSQCLSTCGIHCLATPTPPAFNLTLCAT